ncbi:hypothetical protein ABWH96_05285 [Marivirga tractuosa]|uniref:hypothetical protein n=1 Tax=Marivirga tractuosa TaxID=1006 RepID=UPI0035D069B1
MNKIQRVNLIVLLLLGLIACTDNQADRESIVRGQKTKFVLTEKDEDGRVMSEEYIMLNKEEADEFQKQILEEEELRRRIKELEKGLAYTQFDNNSERMVISITLEHDGTGDLFSARGITNFEWEEKDSVISFSNFDRRFRFSEFRRIDSKTLYTVDEGDTLIFNGVISTKDELNILRMLENDKDSLLTQKSE